MTPLTSRMNHASPADKWMGPQRGGREERDAEIWWFLMVGEGMDNGYLLKFLEIYVVEKEREEDKQHDDDDDDVDYDDDDDVF